MKRYLTNHECSNCGMLHTKESFKHHKEKVCLAIALKNEILRNETENYGVFKDKGIGI